MRLRASYVQMEKREEKVALFFPLKCTATNHPKWKPRQTGPTDNSAPSSDLPHPCILGCIWNYMNYLQSEENSEVGLGAQGTYLTWLHGELDLLASVHPNRSLPRSGYQGQGYISLSLHITKNFPTEQATEVEHWP